MKIQKSEAVQCCENLEILGSNLYGGRLQFLSYVQSKYLLLKVEINTAMKFACRLLHASFNTFEFTAFVKRKSVCKSD